MKLRYGIALACSAGAMTAAALGLDEYPAGTQVRDTAAASHLFAADAARLQQPWREPDAARLPTGSEGEMIRYGIRLLTDTSSLIGPKAADPAMRHAGNNLNCIHCHEAGPSGLPGSKPFALPWVNVANDYPKLDPKSMKVTTLEMRINGMLSTGAKPLADDSREMRAMVAYMKWLGDGARKGERMQGSGLAKVALPNRAADPARGHGLFDSQCAACHGSDGRGRKKPGFESGAGYQFPPLAGADSYDDGGHMYMIPLLTRFLHSNMPFGASSAAPRLSVADAYDIAAYVNSELPRQHNPARVNSYPDPAFQPAGFAIPERFGGDEAAYRRARFGPFAAAQ